MTRESADVTLFGNDLTSVPWLLHWARRTDRIIRMNLIWAFTYNVVGVALAAAGLLNPVWAALLMVLSSIFVVQNSRRITG